MTGVRRPRIAGILAGMRRLFAAWVLGIVSCCLLAQPAGAQEEGVFVDPDSPTGKEYAIPFESERRRADPSAASGGSSATQRAQLFGTGIVADAGAATASRAEDTATAARSSGSSGRRGGSGNAASDAGRPSGTDHDARAVVAAATRNPGAPSGGLSTVAIIGLVAAGALLIGAIAGLLLRRTRA